MGFCDFSEKAVQREAVDVAERKWLQCDGGNEGEEGGAIGGKEREKNRSRTERKRDCKKGIKHPFVGTL